MHRSTAQLETPIGNLWVTVSALGLLEIARANAPPPGTTLDPEAAADVVRELEAYFDGRLRSFETPLDLSGATAFDADVWAAARSIPYGEAASYGELALMAGHPRAARAVGGSMSRCPFSPVVPCHRVIHADGTIGGWGSETWVKRWLLNLERARLPPVLVPIHTRRSANGRDSRHATIECRQPASKRPNSRQV